MKQKSAIVTGASRGIGRAIATSLAIEGYNLIINCHKNTDLLNSLAKSLSNKYHISCIPVIGDISKPDTSKLLCDTCANHFNGITAVIGCAGISQIGLATDFSSEDWHYMFDTNTASCFYLSKYAIPYMMNVKYGRILFVSSVWGERGASCETIYSSTKGAIDSYTKALAKELAPSGISVNALACGMVDTDMNSCFSDREKEEIKEEIPAGRIASAKETGEMAALLLKAPLYLTGQIIKFDGGWQ